MKTCLDCGAEMRDSDLFCTNCGQKYTAPEKTLEEPEIQTEAQPEEVKTEQADTPAQKQEQTEPTETAGEEIKQETPASAPLIISPESGEQSTKYQDEKRAGTKYSAPAYQQPASSAEHIKDPVRMSEWLVNMIVLAVPVVNIVVALIWAFGSETKPSQKSFSRAWLIWAAIGTIIIAAVVVFVAANLYNSLYSFAMPGGGFYRYY